MKQNSFVLKSSGNAVIGPNKSVLKSVINEIYLKPLKKAKQFGRGQGKEFFENK